MAAIVGKRWRDMRRPALGEVLAKFGFDEGGPRASLEMKRGTGRDNRHHRIARQRLCIDNQRPCDTTGSMASMSASHSSSARQVQRVTVASIAVNRVAINRQRIGLHSEHGASRLDVFPAAPR